MNLSLSYFIWNTSKNFSVKTVFKKFNPQNCIQETELQKRESLIPYWLFEEKHIKTIYFRVSFCQSNERYAFKFIRKLEGFTKEKYFFVTI